MANGIAVPDLQRALVFQGPTALGAFEAGVFSTLYNTLRTSPADPAHNNPFDIIAGTSAGAINAAIVVSHVQEFGWQHAADKLLEYWSDNWAVPTPLSVPPPPEDWRRYYAAKNFLAWGVSTVYKPSAFQFPQYDSRFLDNTASDPTNNLWFRYDNSPLVNGWGNTSSNKGTFIKFPVNAPFPNPRLLAVSTDVQSGTSRTFDSYSEPIRPEHIMASSSVPIFYDYQDVGGRKYWDGGVLSNTPLRELIQEHENYWAAVSNNTKVPHLEVYIVDVWPQAITRPPVDHDGVKNRLADIMFCDKSGYDQKAAFLVSNFIEWSKEFAAIPAGIADPAIKAAVQAQINTILAKTATLSLQNGNPRSLQNIINTGVILDKVVTIQRNFDPDSVSNKWTDCSSITIDALIQEGKDYQTTATVKQTP